MFRALIGMIGLVVLPVIAVMAMKEGDHISAALAVFMWPVCGLQVMKGVRSFR